jgi:hypothetical protein
MHFGPEWMRKQPTPASRSSQTDFHPGSTTAISGLNPTAPPPPASSYSASVTFGAVHSENRDGGHTLRYSKEEMIRIYREGVKATLGPEVERWDGIVKEIGADPAGTREMSDAEKRVSTLRCPSSLYEAHSSLRFSLAVLWATQFRDAEATVDQRLSGSSVNHRPRSTEIESRCVQRDEPHAGEVRVIPRS